MVTRRAMLSRPGALSRLGALGLVLTLLLGLLTAPAAATAQGPSGAPGRSTPAAVGAGLATSGGSPQLSACLQSGRTLSALFVLDRSGSLAGTASHPGSDPNGVRYDGLRAALEQLGRLKRPDGSDLVAEAAIAAFDHRYTSASSITPWTRINDGDPAKTIERIIASTKASTAPSGGTDFEQALSGAFQDMKDRGGADNCRVIFWFTDGVFENALNDDVPAARARMCSPKGLLDQIRESGITVVGLQLGRPSITDLQKMSTGSASDGPCGTVPIPEGWATGVYLEANDTAGLKRLFVGLTQIIQGCTPTESRGALVDPGIGQMVIDIDTPRRVQSIRLDSPDGVSMNAPSTGNFDQSGYRVTSISDDHYVSMQVSFPSGRGAGTWRINPDVAVTPDQIRVSVCSGLHLAFDPQPPSAKAGVESTLRIVAQDSGGNPVDLRKFATVVPAGTATAYGGHVLDKVSASVAPDGAVGLTVLPRPTDGQIDVDVVVQLTTASGLKLTPLRLASPVKSTLAVEFPLVDPAEQLRLSEARKLNPASGTLTLVGSPVGPTKICLEDPTAVVIPADAAGSTMDYPRGCVDLAANERKQITVSVTPKAPAVGNGSAVIPAVLHSAATPSSPAQQARVGVRVTWRFENPLSPTNFLLTVLILLVGVLLPLLAIAAANVVTAKYEVRRLYHDVIPVVIDELGLRRATPLAVDPTGQRVIDPMALVLIAALGSKPRKSLAVGSVTLQAAGSWRPDRAPRFWVSAPPHTRIRSTAGPTVLHGTQAPTIPGLGFLGILVAEDSALAASADGRPSKQVPATLVVLVRDRSKDDELDRRLIADLGGGLLDGMRADAPTDSPSVGGSADEGLRTGDGSSSSLPPDTTYTLRGME